MIIAIQLKTRRKKRRKIHSPTKHIRMYVCTTYTYGLCMEKLNKHSSEKGMPHRIFTFVLFVLSIVASHSTVFFFSCCVASPPDFRQIIHTTHSTREWLLNFCLSTKQFSQDKQRITRNIWPTRILSRFLFMRNENSELSVSCCEKCGKHPFWFDQMILRL